MKKIIFLGLVSFLLATIWQLPLSIAKPYVEKMVNTLKLDKVSGTVWQGKVQHFSIQNTNLGKVNWNVQPLQSILSLSLKSSFKIKSPDLSAQGIVAITPTKTLILNNTVFDLDANYINTLQNKTVLAGDIRGSIKYAKLDQQRNLPEVDALINWQGGAMQLPIKLEPGDYHAVITPESDKLNIKLTSSEAPLELNGNIVLNKEWQYDANITAKAQKPGLRAMLNIAGKAQNDGSALIKQKGDLKPFIK
ncbi:MAG: type II secretion system protein N [Cocleimonas sp.]